MQDMWQKILDCWQLKAITGFAISTLTFLLGDITAAPFIALWILVAIDTLTRWMAIGLNTLKEHGETGSVWYGIYVAILERKINNESMRGRFQTKALSYLILLIGFNMLDAIIPDKVAGQQIDGLPNTFISTWLAFVEMQSIIENLIEMGMTGLQPIAGWLCRRRSAMTDACKLPGMSSTIPNQTAEKGAMQNESSAGPRP